MRLLVAFSKSSKEIGWKKTRNCVLLILCIAWIAASCRALAPVIISPLETQAARFFLPMETMVPTLLPVPGLACFGTAFGLSCLDESGWHNYTRQNSGLRSDQVFDIAMCPDHRLMILHDLGLDVLDSAGWRSIDDWGEGTPAAVFCDKENHPWVIFAQGVSLFDGQSWKMYNTEDITSSAPYVIDLTSTTDGEIWALTPLSIAHFEGETWRVYLWENQRDTPTFFTGVAAGKDGDIWIADQGGILRFNQGVWEEFQKPGFDTISSITVDGVGHIWVGTPEGLLMFDPQQEEWINYHDQAGGLNNNDIRAVSADDRGRLWVSSEWGLNVFVNGGWVIYRMDNAGLVDNSIHSMVVLEGGPSLPQALQSPAGSISGRVVEEGAPLGGVVVEVCGGYLGSGFIGESPCEGKPFVRRVNSDTDGGFSFPNLPAGRYHVLAQDNSGLWAQLETGYGASELVLVTPGEETALGDLLIE